MLVSVIIPVHQITSYFKDCVESATNQTYHNIEIILACNGDLTIERCRTFLDKCDKRLIYIKTLNGRHKARTAAIEVSKGEMIQFLDYDDILFSDKIEKQIAELGKNIKATLLISQWKKFKISVTEIYNFPFLNLFDESNISSKSLISKLGKSGAFIATASWLISRDIAIKGRWIDSPNDDAVYLSSILKENPRIIMIPKILAGYRMHENNTSSSRTRKDLNNLLKSWKIIENNLKPMKVPELNLYLYKSYLYLISYSRDIQNYRIKEILFKTIKFGIKGRIGVSVFTDIIRASLQYIPSEKKVLATELDAKKNLKF